MITKEEIHNIYLHQSGVAEGLSRAGADADFPVLFANALLEFYESKKAQEIEAKYGITTKWDGITTYHETTEPIGKAQEK